MDLESFQSEVLSLALIVDRELTNNNLSYMLKAGSVLGAVRHSGFIPWDDDFDILMSYSDFCMIPRAVNLNGGCTLKFLPPLHAGNLNCFGKFVLEVECPNDGHLWYLNGKASVAFVDVFFYGNLSSSFAISRIQYLASRLMIAYSHSLKPPSFRAEKPRWARLIYLLVGKLPERVYYICQQIYVGSYIKEPKRYCDHLDGSHFGRGLLFERNLLSASMSFEGFTFLVPGDTLNYLKRLYGDFMELPPASERKPSHINFGDDENYEKYD